MIKRIIDILYPPRCPICQEIIDKREGRRACAECIDRLQYISEPRCKRCSKPIEDAEHEFCQDCMKKEFHYSTGRAVWVYDEQMKRSIAGFKFSNKKEYAEFYVDESIRLYADVIKRWNVDIIVPVPVHRSKLRERGYNQASIIAEGLSRRLSIPAEPELLVRTRKTLPQKSLNDIERLKNLENAFMVSEIYKLYLGKGKRILIVDDIYTTGSTVEACARALKKAGAQEVFFFSLCIGRGL